MLSKVEVRNPQGDLLTLTFEDETGLLVTKIDGLGPVKATLVGSDFANLDGQQYQSARRELRNIVVQLGLEPDYTMETVEGLRKRVYGFFMPKAPVALRFFPIEIPTVDILGMVESCDPAIFSDEPAIDISILCFNPDFLDVNPVTINEETTSTETEILVDYDGTVETGVKLTLELDRDIDEFTFYHRAPNDELRILEFSYALLAGDVLVIDTRVGEKGATLTRSSTTSSVTKAVSPQSTWTQFMQGANHIRVYAEGLGIPYTLEYVTKYGGL